jgi:hypothetical protein
MEKALHLVLLCVSAVILSLFRVYSVIPIKSYKSLGMGYAQKLFLGYSRKYSNKTSKNFFDDSSLIEVQEKL